MAPSQIDLQLQALQSTYKQTIQLIQQLQKFGSGSSSRVHDDDARVELGNEIHESLKEQEDSLELLRQEVDDASDGKSQRTVRGAITHRRDSERTDERERIAAAVARLSEDLRTARAAFRKAQLQAKRNADNTKRKGRERLFSNRHEDGESRPPSQRKGQETLTQDDLAITAAIDVTAGLQRSNALLQSNLEQSEFAQQTLEESQAALQGLGESYTDLGDILKNSRGLVGQLLRSQKSDTWYLETAFYILVATLSWLVFRRLIYGPAWWLVYQPLRWSYWFLVSIISGVGIIGKGMESSAVPASASALQGMVTPGFNARGMPTHNPDARGPPRVVLPNKGAGWDRPNNQPIASGSAQKTQSEIDKIGDMVDRVVGQFESMPDDAEEYLPEEARNTKKRMMEAGPSQQYVRDEL